MLVLGVFFHGTLTILGQMTDEILMIFLVIQLLINALDITSNFLKFIAYCYSIVYSWYIYLVSQSDIPVHEFYIFQSSILFFAITIFVSFIKANIREEIIYYKRVFLYF